MGEASTWDCGNKVNRERQRERKCVWGERHKGPFFIHKRIHTGTNKY